MSHLVSEIVKFPQSNNEQIAVSGFHGISDFVYLLGKKNIMNRTISGILDEYYYAFIVVDILNPNSGFILKNAKAVIDTGAAHCLLKSSIIKELGLTSFRDNEYLHPQYGIRKTGNFLIDINIDTDNSEGSALIQGLRVAELEDETYPSEMIIGVEFLRYCNFKYLAENKIFELSIKIP